MIIISVEAYKIKRVLKQVADHINNVCHFVPCSSIIFIFFFFFFSISENVSIIASISSTFRSLNRIYAMPTVNAEKREKKFLIISFIFQLAT